MKQIAHERSLIFDMKYIKLLLRSVFRIVGVLLVVLLGCWIFLAQPTLLSNSKSSIKVSADKLKGHVEKLAVDFYPRSCWEFKNLNATADYVSDHFKKAGAH